MVVMMREW
uniref:Uncharacterized protein n=1 Tax=Arundo donax TaxID=35708 RepID=A0A0A9F2G9_ARUDO